MYWFVILIFCQVFRGLFPPDHLALCRDWNLEIFLQLVDFGVHSPVDGTIHGSWNSFLVEELVDFYIAAHQSALHIPRKLQYLHLRTMILTLVDVCVPCVLLETLRLTAAAAALLVLLTLLTLLALLVVLDIPLVLVALLVLKELLAFLNEVVHAGGSLKFGYGSDR